GFDLRHLGELVARRNVLHHLVTAGAPDVARLVRAPLPEEVGAFRVAGGAHRIAFFDGRLVVPGERDHPADTLAATRLDVLLPRAGTVLAPDAPRGVSRS